MKLLKLLCGVAVLCVVATSSAVAGSLSRTYGKVTVCQYPDSTASFPGGMEALARWINSHISYPQEAAAEGVTGRNVLRLTIDADSTVTGWEIVYPSGSVELDMASRNIPWHKTRWIPARRDCAAVASYLFVPIAYLTTDSEELAKKQGGVKEKKEDRKSGISAVSKLDSGEPAEKPKGITAGNSIGDSRVIVEEEEPEKVYEEVDTPASFPGGQEALMRWLSENMRYPVYAQETGAEGCVAVRFKVGRDGSVHDVEVTRSVCASLDDEAVRVVADMPKWQPGKVEGRSVVSYYELPVTFLLSDGADFTVYTLRKEKK